MNRIDPILSVTARTKPFETNDQRNVIADGRLAAWSVDDLSLAHRVARKAHGFTARFAGRTLPFRFAIPGAMRQAPTASLQLGDDASMALSVNASALDWLVGALDGLDGSSEPAAVEGLSARLSLDAMEAMMAVLLENAPACFKPGRAELGAPIDLPRCDAVEIICDNAPLSMTLYGDAAKLARLVAQAERDAPAPPSPAVSVRHVVGTVKIGERDLEAMHNGCGVVLDETMARGKLMVGNRLSAELKMGTAGLLNAMAWSSCDAPSTIDCEIVAGETRLALNDPLFGAAGNNPQDAFFVTVADHDDVLELRGRSGTMAYGDLVAIGRGDTTPFGGLVLKIVEVVGQEPGDDPLRP